MNRFLDALRAGWHARETRERRALAVMAAALAAFAYWYLLAVPLRSLAEGAGQRHQLAAAGSASFDRKLQEIGQRLAMGDSNAATPIDAAALARMAADAGLGARVEAMPDNRGIKVAFDAAGPEALFAWLSELRQQQGLRPQHAVIIRGPAGLHGELQFPMASR